MRSMVALSLVVGAMAALSGCKDEKDPPVVLPPAMDQCLAAADMALILSLQGDGGLPDAGPFEVPLASALECGAVPGCLDPLLVGNVDAGYACVDNCYDTKPAAGLSDSCRYCYIVNGLFCAGAFCLVECLGTDSAVCNTCFSQQCREALDTCVGF